MLQQSRNAHGDGQPQAQPLDLAGGVRVQALELIEDAFLVFVSNAWARVPHLDAHRLAAAAAAQKDPALARVIDRIAQEILDGPPQEVGVGPHPEGAGDVVQLHALALGGHAELVDQFLQNRGQFHVTGFRLQAP